jgi:Ca2+-binding RTX toxin-like protein
MGDDTFVVDSASEVVTENPGEGIDLVLSSANYFFAPNVENGRLTGSASINMTGNAGPNALLGNGGNNQLIGGAGNDTLDGGPGADNMTGGGDDDTYVVDNAADVVNEGGSGIDTVQTLVDSYMLGATLENLMLFGSALAGTGNALSNTITGNIRNNTLSGGDLQDTLIGGAGNDTLLGGNGHDSMIGGAGLDRFEGGPGSDTYVVDSASEVIVENPDEGSDTVQSTSSFFLAANFESLTLIGTANVSATGNNVANVITGNSGANSINAGAGNDRADGGDGNDSVFGSAGYDTLIGGIGDDTLNGGSAFDQYTGGVGDDLYIVDVRTEIITELLNEGNDSVQSAASYALPENVEHLTLTGVLNVRGTGNALANTIDGNGGNNPIAAGGGDDTIDGGGGVDTLAGGAGNDRFVFNAGEANGDRIGDFNGAGTLAGDELVFQGYTGGTFVQVNATTWEIRSTAPTETIIFTNSAAIDPTDFAFV